MKELGEVEQKIVEHLQKAHPTAQSEDQLVISLGRRAVWFGKILERLVRKNYITKKEQDGPNLYFISETNKKVNFRALTCPKCQTTRMVFAQGQASCSNATCRTPNGRKRTFWVEGKKPGKVMQPIVIRS